MSRIGPVDVRRLGAVDMHGTRGAPPRRRLILAEFVVGAVACIAIGLAILIPGPGDLVWAVIGVLLLGWGCNYAPLAIHAAALYPGDALTKELAGADIPAELRHYTAAQLWIAVPFLFLPLDLLQRRARRVR